jgi:hypothetical protein
MVAGTPGHPGGVAAPGRVGQRIGQQLDGRQDLAEGQQPVSRYVLVSVALAQVKGME